MSIEARDGRDDNPIFIHSDLDDYGLSAIEFRVYARLARRCGGGAAFESVPNMAKEFEVSDRTIQRALKLLTECRLIAETVRPGKTTLYTLNPRRLWLHKKLVKEIREKVFNKRVTGDTTAGGDTRDGGGVTPERGVVVTPERDEGTPPEGTTPKGEPPSPRFLQAVRIFAEVYGHEPHVLGQTDIETELKETPDFDFRLWRDVVRQCRGNNTPAKNVGTMLRMCREERERRAVRGSPPGSKPIPVSTETREEKEARLKAELTKGTHARRTA